MRSTETMVTNFIHNLSNAGSLLKRAKSCLGHRSIKVQLLNMSQRLILSGNTGHLEKRFVVKESHFVI